MLARNESAAKARRRLSAWAAVCFVALAAGAAGAELRVRVVDDLSGAPQSSVDVRVGREGARELVAEMETGPEGRARNEKLTAATYQIEFAKAGYLPLTLTFRLPSPEVTVRLVPYGVIRGQVYGSDGAPLRLSPLPGAMGPSAIICLFRESDPLNVVQRVAVGPEGRFMIEAGPGVYHAGLWYSGLPEGGGVQFFSRGGAPEAIMLREGEERQDINFLLRPGSGVNVSGRVESPVSGPVFVVTLAVPDRPAAAVARSLTDDTGSFRFYNIAAGEYDVLAAGAQESETFFGRQRIRVSAGEPVTSNILAGAGRNLEVIFAGSENAERSPSDCPASATAIARPLEPWGAWSTRARGVKLQEVSALAAVPPGLIQISVNDLGNRCFSLSSTIVDSRLELERPLRLRVAAAGGIAGRVGTPPSGSAIVVVLAAENVSESPVRVQVPDGSGRFRFEGLRPGRYRISALSGSASRSAWFQDPAAGFPVDVQEGAKLELDLPLISGDGKERGR